MSFNNLFKEFPTIKTERLNLRRLRLEDSSDLVDYFANKKVCKYLNWDGPKNLDKGFEIINIWNRQFSNGELIKFAIALKDSDKVIGTISLTNFKENKADISYELNEDYWRQGIMSEAINAVVSFAFEKLNLVRIQGFVRDENIASKELLKKLNFKEEGLLRKYELHTIDGTYNDMCIFGLLKEDLKN